MSGSLFGSGNQNRLQQDGCFRMVAISIITEGIKMKTIAASIFTSLFTAGLMVGLWWFGQSRFDEGFKAGVAATRPEISNSFFKGARFGGRLVAGEALKRLNADDSKDAIAIEAIACTRLDDDHSSRVEIKIDNIEYRDINKILDEVDAEIAKKYSFSLGQ